MADYLDYLNRMAKAPFDIVFVDPPYAQGFYKPALKALLDNELLKPSSLIICESADASPFEGDTELMSNFKVIKQSKYGNSLITLFGIIDKEN
jgi:16S rRNA (guanine966-N2)-methyltransferase